jgi:hypothetical protein
VARFTAILYARAQTRKTALINHDLT